jgi:hypothetical protein
MNADGLLRGVGSFCIGADNNPYNGRRMIWRRRP